MEAVRPQWSMAVTSIRTNLVDDHRLPLVGPSHRIDNNFLHLDTWTCERPSLSLQANKKTTKTPYHVPLCVIHVQAICDSTRDGVLSWVPRKMEQFCWQVVRISISVNACIFSTCTTSLIDQNQGGWIFCKESMVWSMYRKNSIQDWRHESHLPLLTARVKEVRVRVGLAGLTTCRLYGISQFQ